ncbi:MAG: nucleotide exchange factor GrpE [Candidatus Cryptobacteroides sp.]
MAKENKEKELKEEVLTPQEDTTVQEKAEEDVEASSEESVTEEAEEETSGEPQAGNLEKRIEELEGKLAKEKDDYIRLMAEFDNFRRRTAQEKLDLVAMASTDTIKGLLPVLDDCERAISVLNESTDSDAAKEGTNLIYQKLMAYLKSKGLAVIEAKDQVFDTDMHEAVAQFPVQEEDKKGKVFDVVQTGYTLNGKVIRFAKVVVGI